MPMISSRLFFDKDDYELLRIVKKVLSRTHKHQSMSSLMIDSMHPHGIKEMAATSGLRIAYAIAQLLGSLETGKADDRLKALRSLRDEVFLSATSFYQKNTARVLMQIMKELIRCRDSKLRQLKLAHDFRLVSSGRPRLVRSELAHYHLLEMPEEWNQFTFDDRVHDANTKGRKSATHLVMDAWIKGIRNLTVIYYNYVEPEIVEELLEAGEILDVHIRVGIEISSRFYDKYVRLTWSPHGFTDNHSFLNFLREPPIKELMQEGRQVSLYQQSYVFEVLEAFNSRHRQALSSDFSLQTSELDREGFISSVGTGQPSLLHLAKYIHSALQPQMEEEVQRLRKTYETATSDQRRELDNRLRTLNTITHEMLINRYLQPCRNPGILDPNVPRDDDTDITSLLRCSLPELLGRLSALHSGSHFTLNLSNLSIQDTLELLYNCQGKITHIEAYNLKDASHGMTAGSITSAGGLSGEAVAIVNPERTYSLINTLQKALNEDNVIILKRTIRDIIWDFEGSRVHLERRLEQSRKPETESDLGTQGQAMELAAMNERKERLLNILYNIESFHTYYKKRSLGSRIGSGSTGQSEYQYGMGLVVLDTLPPRARKEAIQEVKNNRRKCIPITAQMVDHRHSRISEQKVNLLERLLGYLPGSRRTGRTEWSDWTLETIELHPGREGNVATLGGLRHAKENSFKLGGKAVEEQIDKPLKYMNTGLKNLLKVLVGFIPAFLTFSLTKDWWVLAYLGAFIWFGVTGLRNIIQSVLGGGGLKRSPLLQWNSFISWSRIADSLLYTGFSVPLLDFLVKTQLLDRTFGVTTSTNPILLYSAMALANGIYISTHNIFRGLPKSAAVGNFFRSILSIPLAILFNAVIASILHTAMVPGVEEALQKWAAVISKLASDCVAAVIEGLADRQSNIRIRLADYKAKLALLFGLFARLELLFPEEDVLDMLQSPKIFMETINYEARDLEKAFIVNALDLMYFWMYQPRARKALQEIVKEMSTEEWLILYRSQLILKRYREISQIFVDGLVGKYFSKALAFYLERYEEYLAGMARISHTKGLIVKKE
ncbi:MAG: CPBP family intramembrane metalloprotease [Desulfoprunum sp.]|nr:CPBP family intramembrane metalloprotease [Desulfoprunum sp.]